jgi:iron complex transport system substrate-binding protein
MIRRIAISLLFLAAGCTRPAGNTDSPQAASDGAFPVTVRDDLGRKVTIARPPERIVSLGPAVTEMLFAVGAGARVVAVTTTDNFPPEVERLPNVGGFAPETISLETTLAQKPDLVIAAARFQQPVVEALARFGINAVVIDPDSLDGVLDAIVLVGKMTGRKAQAEDLAADLRRRREAVRRNGATIKPAGRNRVLYVLWDEPLQTSGANTFVSQLITEAGGCNVFADAGQQYPQVSDEVVLSSNPDLILAPDHGGAMLRDRLARRPSWGQLAAVKAGRIVTIPEDLLHRPGPRIIDGLERIAALLRGNTDKGQ